MINAVIVYLSRKLDISDLKKSLKLLHKNFTKRYNYPVLIFHDDFTNEDQNTLLKIYSNIEFEELKFEVPSWIDKSQINKGSHNIRITYMHMCRFFSGEIYKHNALKNYDWYWRLDSDSYIRSPIKYDIFNVMERKGFEHGYLETSIKDSPKFVIGLWDLTKEFIQKNNIQPTFLKKYLDKDGEWDRSLFYTNFELSKLDFWKSEEYKRYYNIIDQNGGIYYYRWGDHTIHLLALSMLVDENKILFFKDIDYSHQNFRPNRKFPNLMRLLTSGYNLIIQKLKNIRN
jgi:alpha 1,2-mannosyltransferase